MLAVWSNEPRSFVPPVTHKPRDAVSSRDSWEESAMSGMATFPKLMSYCLKSLWGRLCWSQRPCLACFLPKVRVQVTQVPKPSCVRHGLSICGVVWCAWAVGLGYARTLLPAAPQKAGISALQGTTEMWRSKGWQEMSLGRKACSHPYLRNSESAPFLKVQLQQSPLYGHRINHSVPASPNLEQ